MGPTRIAGLFAALSFAALSAVAAPALADDNYSVNAGKGAVTVTAAKGWHINTDYSWAVKKGSDKVKKKEDFKFDGSTASVAGVPAGTYTLKGAVCTEDKSQCAPFTKDVTVQ